MLAEAETARLLAEQRAVLDDPNAGEERHAFCPPDPADCRVGDLRPPAEWRRDRMTHTPR